MTEEETKHECSTGFAVTVRAGMRCLRKDLLRLLKSCVCAFVDVHFIKVLSLSSPTGFTAQNVTYN